MGVLRRYLWLWVVGGMVLASLLISFIFLFINRCITRAGQQTIMRRKRRAEFNVESNKYQERSPNTPPLPPRTQFHQTGSQGYENMVQENLVQENLVQENLHSSDRPPDHLKMEDEADRQPPSPLYQRPHRHLQTRQNPAEEHDYERSTSGGQQNPDDQPDYVRVEDEVEPPVCPTDTAHDSSEDYDDIGGEEEEDYDDVG